MIPVPCLADPHLYDKAPLSRPLRKRLVTTLSALLARPDSSLPAALGAAGYTGLLRMIHHPRVTSASLATPVFAATHRRAHKFPQVLAVHDTTECSFGGKARRDGLGPLRAGGQGFFLHTCLLLTDDDVHAPLGVAAAETHVRSWDPVPRRKGPRWRPTHNDTESARWPRQIEVVQTALGDVCTSVIHVGDRETDDYALLAGAVHSSWRFVFRMSHDRRIVPATDEGARKAREHVRGTTQGRCERWVALSERTATTPHQRTINPSRAGRMARLLFDATTITLVRPENQPLTLPATLTLNVVRVWEPETPAGEPSVEWLLYTTEPIATVAQVLRIVDVYRARWRIEELFKALKTGCTYEDCQAESRDALEKVLWLYLPIAACLLALRDYAARTPEADATPENTGLPAEALELLRDELPRGASRLTVVRVVAAIAKLGGHLRASRDPGWLVLLRGMTVLLERVEGWQRAIRRRDAGGVLTPKTDRS